MHLDFPFNDDPQKKKKKKIPFNGRAPWLVMCMKASECERDRYHGIRKMVRNLKNDKEFLTKFGYFYFPRHDYIWPKIRKFDRVRFDWYHNPSYTYPNLSMSVGLRLLFRS